jgi:CBS domain-containing protein
MALPSYACQFELKIDMTVRALPSFPTTLSLTPDATVIEALRIMLAQQVNHIPVCTVEGQFIGMISSNSILRELVPASARVGHSLDNLSFAGDALPMLLDHLRDVSGKKVSELADGNGNVLQEDTPLLQAAKMLSETAAPLPVVSADGRLVGMLSRRVILGYLLGQAQGT